MGKPQRPDPTPAEIVAMCREIQSGWSPAERQKRAIGFKLGANGQIAGPYSADVVREAFAWSPPIASAANLGLAPTWRGF